MGRVKWPKHCRTCQYRRGYKGVGFTCDYLFITDKSLVKEYGFYGGDPQVIRDMCTHYQDDRDSRTENRYGRNNLELKQRIRKETLERERKQSESTPRRRTRKTSTHREQEMELRLTELTGQGLTPEEIATELGVSRTTVCSWAKELGITLRRERQKAHPSSEYTACFDKGMEDSAIAELLDVSLKTVTNHRAKYIATRKVGWRNARNRNHKRKGATAVSATVVHGTGARRGAHPHTV